MSDIQVEGSLFEGLYWECWKFLGHFIAFELTEVEELI